VAAAMWAAEQPLDKRLFGSEADDVELLGKLVTTGPGWPAAGTALHVLDGALFGALYAELKPFLPGPAPGRAVIAAMAEHLALWPLTRLIERRHPAGGDLAATWAGRRAFAQSAWRHLLFGAILGLLEERLNATRHEEPPPVELSSNGYGDIEAAPVAAG
jgi:hypothetical protein